MSASDAGLPVELGPFASRVLLDWQEVVRDGRAWDVLADRLGGRGIPDLESALWDLAVEPLHRALGTLLAHADRVGEAAYRDEAANTLATFLSQCARLLSRPMADPAAPAMLRDALEADRRTARTTATAAETAAQVAWRFLAVAGAAFDRSGPTAAVRLFDELRLRSVVAAGTQAHGADSAYAWRLAAQVRAQLAHPHARYDQDAWQRFVSDPDARFAAGLDEHATMADAPAWLPQAGHLVGN